MLCNIINIEVTAMAESGDVLVVILARPKGALARAFKYSTFLGEDDQDLLDDLEQLTEIELDKYQATVPEYLHVGSDGEIDEKVCTTLTVWYQPGIEDPVEMANKLLARLIIKGKVTLA